MGVSKKTVAVSTTATVTDVSGPGGKQSAR